MHDSKQATLFHAAARHDDNDRDDSDDEPTRTLTHEEFLRAKARALQNLDRFLARLRFQKKDS